VRDQLPPGFPYEFVIVDGGSQDGTPAWCEQQPDVRFIQQGKLLGAIRAFDAGCEAAQGEYVLIANDDILFHEGSIVRALAHLFATPTCGAVAFMDNRRAPGYDTDDFKVQTIRAVKNGEYVDVIYAQVGLFRKQLGNQAGWWGSRDPLMGETHTYGGDSYLSARIWELGYTVDAVEGVICTDRVAPDGLRQRNHGIEQQIGSAYYRRYPNGVTVGAIAEAAADRLRILYLPLFSPNFGRYKSGLYDALAEHGDVYELNYDKHRLAFPAAVAAFQPHLILTQFHNADTITPAMLQEARSYAPGAVVINWVGDVYIENLVSPGMIELLKHIDLQLVVNAEALSIYEDFGIPAAYWQIGYEPVPDNLPQAREHDLLFMANAYRQERKALGQVLNQLSTNVGLYGVGWSRDNESTLYDFVTGAALYRACKIAIGDNMYGDKGFVSNRLFEALANGAFLLHQHIPGLEELTGLVDGVHYVSWKDHDDLRDKVRHYLHFAAERHQIAAAGERYVREHHSFQARVKELFETLLPKVANERQLV
jgi:glycosyltransferase involved in cell wall biosynthesis